MVLSIVMVMVEGDKIHCADHILSFSAVCSSINQRSIILLIPVTLDHQE